MAELTIDGEPRGYRNDVNMHYDVSGDEQDYELSVKLTHEGIIVDVLNENGEVIGTRGWMADEMLWSILG